MVLGRTSSGAIKIKTDEAGTPRAVECACCGGKCPCERVMLISPPDDPDFTKKLLGTDPNVTPFTQVTLAWGVTSETYDPVAYNPVVCSWPNRTETNRIYPVNIGPGEDSCGKGGFLGYFSSCESYIVGCEEFTARCLEDKGYANLWFYVNGDTGCMHIEVWELFSENVFWAYTKGGEAASNENGFLCAMEDDPRISIKINGQHYPAIVADAGTVPWAWAMLTSGFVDINFS